MGHRLSKIYTRTGDQGTSGLGDGRRIDKDHLRIEAIGTVDELNSLIGVVLSQSLPAPCREMLVAIQHELFDLGGELAVPGTQFMQTSHVTRLEQWLDQLNQELSPLQEFILPGGCLAAAHCHHARSVCRRTERRAVSLARAEEINPQTIAYLNRLSDLLFVMARYLNLQAGHADVLWRHDR